MRLELRQQRPPRGVGQGGKGAVEDGVLILNHWVKFMPGAGRMSIGDGGRVFGAGGLVRAPLTGRRQVDRRGGPFYGPANLRAVLDQRAAPPRFQPNGWLAMKIKNSLRSLRKRHRNCRVVRRRGRLYVINKTNRRFKARQG